MPTHSTGVFTRSPMPALIAGRILRGARRAKTPRRRPSAPRARPVTPLSTAVLSCWPVAVSSPSRAWADSIWPATPPMSRRWSSCAVASAAATSRLPLWCAALPILNACAMSMMPSAACWPVASAPLCCCAAVLLAKEIPPTALHSRHPSRTIYPSLASCSPIHRFSICCLQLPRRMACTRWS